MAVKLTVTEDKSNFHLFKPFLIGSFRSDISPVSNHNIQELYLKYIPRLLTRPLELKKGFKNYMKDKSSKINNKFENLLEWLKLNQSSLEHKEQFLNLNSDNNTDCDFIALNGVLSYLLKCPYESETGYDVLAEKFNGSIYLKLVKKPHLKKSYNNRINQNNTNPINLNDQPNRQSKQKPINNVTSIDFDLANYCSQKFREYYTEKLNKEVVDPESGNEDFSESKLNQWKTEWISFGKKVEQKSKQNNNIDQKITFVYKTKIKEHIIIFAEEIDCFEQIDSLNNDQIGIVKFKLQKNVQTSDYSNSIRKLRWSTCAFGLVHRLVVGFWQFNYKIDQVLEYSPDTLYSNLWDKNVCFNHLNQSLTFIKNSFIQLDSNSIRLIHNPHLKELVCVGSEYSVLPSFYKKNFFLN